MALFEDRLANERYGDVSPLKWHSSLLTVTTKCALGAGVKELR